MEDNASTRKQLDKVLHPRVPILYVAIGAAVGATIPSLVRGHSALEVLSDFGGALIGAAIFLGIVFAFRSFSRSV